MYGSTPSAARDAKRASALPAGPNGDVDSVQSLGMTAWEIKGMTAPAKTPEVFDLLKRCASEMRTIAYSEIAEQVGLANVGVGTPLGYIRDHVCRERRLPWLNAIAVNATTRRPSDGFLPIGVTIAADTEERLWRGMVLQVFAFDWSKVRLDEPG